MSNFGDKQDWDAFAIECLKNHKHGRPTYRSVLKATEILSRYISLTDKSLLDCGCNVGHWSSDFTKLSMEVVGVDQSSVAIDNAKKLYPHIKFMCNYLWDLKFDSEFDVLITVTVLQHNTLPEQKRLLPCLYKALKPGGLMLNIEGGGPTVPTEQELSNPMRTTHSVIGWIDLIASNGFKLVEYQEPEWYLFRKVTE